MKKALKVFLPLMLNLGIGQDYQIALSYIPIGQGISLSDSNQVMNSIGGLISKNAISDSFDVGPGFLKTTQSILAEPPVVTDFQFSSLIEKNGSPVTVSAIIYDLNGIQKSELYLQPGGVNDTETILSMTNVRNNVFEALIPDSLINFQSFRARILTIDNTNSSTLSDYYTPSIYFYNGELSMENLFSSYPEGVEKNQWKLISWPAKPDDISLAEYTLDQGHVFYSWNPVKNSFSIANRIQLGQSYWFRHIYDDPIVFQEDSSSSIPLEDFIIDLESGWNLIGSPFSFPVQFEKDSMVSNPITYGVSGKPRGWSDGQSELHPWRGYAVYTPIDATITLNPFPDSTNISYRETSLNEWYIKIKIEDDNYVNHSAEIGRSKNAKDLFDVFDTPVYPELEAGLVLLSDINGTKNYNYIRDIRNIHNPNGVWNLRLVGGQKESKINFSAELQGSFLENMRASLVDVNTRTIYYNIFSEKLLFTPVSNIDHELRLVVGDLEYVNLMTKEILDNIPSDFTLSQNYPNPFNPITKIDYTLPTRSLVSISIYNVLGHEVRRLVNEVRDYGYHTTEWDGKDNNGNDVASGVYFTTMISKSYIQTKKMLLLK